MSGQDDRIRVLLVDDHETIHVEIGGLLASLDDVHLVARGYNGEEAVQLCEQHIPDIVLMDISMPIVNGMVATRVILSRLPEIKILALSGLAETRIIQNMLLAGAVGYILKDAGPEELASTLRAVHHGKSVFSRDLIGSLLHDTSHPAKSLQDYGLTRREIDVLLAMSQGLNNGEVAQKLNISTATVRFHITNIIEKLGVANRTEALIVAARQDLI